MLLKTQLKLVRPLYQEDKRIAILKLETTYIFEHFIWNAQKLGGLLWRKKSAIVSFFRCITFH